MNFSFFLSSSNHLFGLMFYIQNIDKWSMPLILKYSFAVLFLVANSWSDYFKATVTKGEPPERPQPVVALFDLYWQRKPFCIFLSQTTTVVWRWDLMHLSKISSTQFHCVINLRIFVKSRYKLNFDCYIYNWVVPSNVQRRLEVAIIQQTRSKLND